MIQIEPLEEGYHPDEEMWLFTRSNTKANECVPYIDEEEPEEKQKSTAIFQVSEKDQPRPSNLSKSNR